MQDKNWWKENGWWVACLVILLAVVAYMNRASFLAAFPALASAFLRDKRRIGGQSMNRVRWS